MYVAPGKFDKRVGLLTLRYCKHKRWDSNLETFARAWNKHMKRQPEQPYLEAWPRSKGAYLGGWTHPTNIYM